MTERRMGNLVGTVLPGNFSGPSEEFPGITPVGRTRTEMFGPKNPEICPLRVWGLVAALGGVIAVYGAAEWALRVK